MDDQNDSSPIQGSQKDSASAVVSSETLSPTEQPSVDPNSLRGAVGSGMDRFSQLVNENLVAARYGVFAGVTLLTVYGLSQTPLFFRYRTVADVPGKWGRICHLRKKLLVSYESHFSPAAYATELLFLCRIVLYRQASTVWANN
jgi:hypothetical protein